MTETLAVMSSLKNTAQKSPSGSAAMGAQS